jgi:hypothetical protein
MSCDITRVLPEGVYGSSFLNSQITGYGDLVYYIKTMLGYPSAPVELDDGQFKVIIDDALEMYTRWVRGEEKMLIFCPDLDYDASCGIRLDYLINSCNTCLLSCATTSVTGTSCVDVLLGTTSSLLSVTQPFFTPTEYYDLSKNDSPKTTAYEFEQFITLNYNPADPWNTQDFCDFDKIIIRPKNSNWYELSANPTIWQTLSSLSISALTAYPISSIPVSSFYGPLTATTWPLEAYMNVVSGIGNVFPAGDLTRFDVCPAPEYFWRIDPNLSIRLLDTNHVPYVGMNSCDAIDSYILTAQYLSGTDGVILDNPWVVSADLNGDDLDDEKLTYIGYISASDGSVFPPSHLNTDPNTYIELINFPYCVTNNQIPLNWNNGIVANFSLCNSSLNTFGDIAIPTVKFLSGGLPASNMLYQSLTGWDNGGFRLKKKLSQGDFCTLKVPGNPAVDIDFYSTTCEETSGTEVSYLSGSYDYNLGNFRKIQGCFSADMANNGYGLSLIHI